MEVRNSECGIRNSESSSTPNSELPTPNSIPNSGLRTFRRAGQSAVEYVVVLAAVAAALLTMAVYMKRGVSGSLRASTDSVGEQYHPKHSSTGPGGIIQTFSSDITTVSELIPDVGVDLDGDRVADIVADTMETASGISRDTSQRTGSEYVGALTGDLWD